MDRQAFPAANCISESDLLDANISWEELTLIDDGNTAVVLPTGKQ